MKRFVLWLRLLVADFWDIFWGIFFWSKGNATPRRKGGGWLPCMFNAFLRLCEKVGSDMVLSDWPSCILSCDKLQSKIWLFLQPLKLAQLLDRFSLSLLLLVILGLMQWLPSAM